MPSSIWVAASANWPEYGMMRPILTVPWAWLATGKRHAARTLMPANKTRFIGESPCHLVANVRFSERGPGRIARPTPLFPPPLQRRREAARRLYPCQLNRSTQHFILDGKIERIQ